MASGPSNAPSPHPHHSMPTTVTIVAPDDDEQPDFPLPDTDALATPVLTPRSGSREPSPLRHSLCSGSFLLAETRYPRSPTPSLSITMADDAAVDQSPGDSTSGTTTVLSTGPFNFQTQFISAGPVESSIGQRRGHRYKHSSVSTQHQIFQEPPHRPPPVLPASLPVPTLREAWASMHRDQRARLYWSLCHAAVAVYIFLTAADSLAMTALSHLVFFDVGSAAVCVAVDVLGNFEVWRRSSFRHPFGLQRAEVLAGFAMSIFLLFGGFDLLSHNLKHMLEFVGEHEAHHSMSDGAYRHGGSRGARYVSPATVDTASLAAVVSTLVSAYGLRNHSRIRRVMRVPLPGMGLLGRVLSSSSTSSNSVLDNPFHSLTLAFAFLMFILPLLSVTIFVWLDRLICAAIAVGMFALGVRLAVAQGLMLLMSYSGRASDKGDGEGNDSHVSSVLREIEADPSVARVEEAQFWQVHYGLAMANLKVCVAGRSLGFDDWALAQLRGRVARVIQNRLGEGYGRGGNLRWEVTVQMSFSG